MSKPRPNKISSSTTSIGDKEPTISHQSRAEIGKIIANNPQDLLTAQYLNRLTDPKNKNQKDLLNGSRSIQVTKGYSDWVTIYQKFTKDKNPNLDIVSNDLKKLISTLEN